jgi:hypothetical protein
MSSAENGWIVRMPTTSSPGASSPARIVVPFTRNRQAGTDDNPAEAMGIIRSIDSSFRFHYSAGAARPVRLPVLRRRSDIAICRIHTTTASGGALHSSQQS